MHNKQYQCVLCACQHWLCAHVTRCLSQVLTNPDNKPLAFVLMCDGNVPHNGVEGGKTESGETLYVGITEVPEAGILPGKMQQSKKGLFVPFDGKELFFSEYKVLVCKE